MQLIFAPDILPLFVKLEEKFTRYELKQISQLTSVYAIRLYELLIRWRSTGKLYISLEDLREKLGLLADEYLKMGDFKKRVLSVALTQINKFTDIDVDYSQKKEGRSISHIEFSFTVKKHALIIDHEISSISYKLSAKQCLFFAQKLCDTIINPQFGSKYAHVGESRQDFEDRIGLELVNPENVKKYYDDLVKVGFKAKVK